MASLTDLSSISGTYWDGSEDGGYGKPLEDELTNARNTFGRTRETLLLREAFEKVLTTKCASTVVVHGESGVGKTSLVDTLRVPVVESRGYFCAGKFFQNSSFQVPYSAITAAFSDLCDLVIQSEDFNEDRRIRIQQGLGTDGHLLTKTISNIAPFLNRSDMTDGETVDLVANENVLSKFHVACKTFIQVMSSDEHPLVLFIDDIQWMDIGSRQLVELFMTDQELNNVLVILSYRDEEAEKIAPLFREGHEVVDIALKGLDLTSISEMVSSFVGETSEREEALACLIAKRSQGNPFHVNSFLAMIENECLMTFDHKTKSWAYDVDEIRLSTMMLCDLADVLARKIGLVHSDIKETLKVASVIGYHFSDSLLVEVVAQLRLNPYPAQRTAASDAHSAAALAELLSRASKMGFVERIKGGFQFTHDKIQTAFHDFIVDGEEEGQIHLIVGDTIISREKEDDTFATIYHAAIHLNASSSFARSGKERLRLVKINLDAAKYCMGKSAFVAASELLREGLSYLNPTEKWSDSYFDVTLATTELFAKAELICGNFESAVDTTSEIVHHAKSSETKMNALVLDVEVRVANNDMGELIVCVQRALQEIGLKMPRHISKRHVLSTVFKLKMMMRNKTDEQILSLRKMEERTVSTAVDLLVRLCQACLLKGETKQAVYSALKAMELTLNHGSSPRISAAFVIYGCVQISMGNHDLAYRMGKLAQRLQATSGCKYSGCFNGYAATILTWRRESMAELKTQLFEAANAGFEVGDVSGAAFCVTQALNFDSFLGSSLREIENSLRYFWGRIAELRQDGLLLWFKPPLQYVLNLQRHHGDWKDVFMMTGDAMEEKQYLREAHEARHQLLHCIVLSFKSFLACWFGYFKEATEFCEQADKIENTTKITYGQLPRALAVSFCNFEHYRVTGIRKYLRKGRQSRKYLEKVARQGSPDAKTTLVFVCAVEMSLKQSIGKQQVLDNYNNAISIFAKERNHRMEGRLNEHAGFDLVRRGHISEARSYFKRALEVYKYQWHANAKYEWLLEQSVMYIEGPQESLSPASQIGSYIVCDTNSKQESK